MPLLPPSFLNVRYPDRREPLRSASLPPLLQCEAVKIGALIVQMPRAPELKGFSEGHKGDLVRLARSWFPHWEPYRPAHDVYRSAVEGNFSPFGTDGDPDGPWCFKSFSKSVTSQTSSSGLHSVTYAIRRHRPFEEAWFTQPFVCFLEEDRIDGDHGIRAHPCCEEITIAMATESRRIHERTSVSRNM